MHGVHNLSPNKCFHRLLYSLLKKPFKILDPSPENIGVRSVFVSALFSDREDPSVRHARTASDVVGPRFRALPITG
jgi:hypothetical protein